MIEDYEKKTIDHIKLVRNTKLDKPDMYKIACQLDYIGRTIYLTNSTKHFEQLKNILKCNNETIKKVAIYLDEHIKNKEIHI